MPGFDGTGPAGGGPITGWGRGYCNTRESESYGFSRSWPRRGIGFGYGRGRGYRHTYWENGLPRWARGRPGLGEPYLEPGYSRRNEVRMLKDEAEAIKEDLNAIERRMKELEAETTPDE